MRDVANAVWLADLDTKHRWFECAAAAFAKTPPVDWSLIVGKILSHLRYAFEVLPLTPRPPPAPPFFEPDPPPHDGEHCYI